MKNTSLAAYRSKIQDGSLTTDAATVYHFIKDNPGVTRLMISDRTDYAINSICGRVCELLDANLLIETKQVKQRTGRLGWALEVIG